MQFTSSQLPEMMAILGSRAFIFGQFSTLSGTMKILEAYWSRSGAPLLTGNVGLSKPSLHLPDGSHYCALNAWTDAGVLVKAIPYRVCTVSQVASQIVS